MTTQRLTRQAETTTAMILAAGKGERMRPLTDKTPKPLLAVGGQPLIVWHILALKRAGVRHLVINASHLAEQLLTQLGDGQALGVNITWSLEQPEPLETAGGIARALPWLSDPFLVVNGDVFCDWPFTHYQAITRTMATVGHLAHLVLVPNPEHLPQGDFALTDGRVVFGQPSLTYAGIGVFRQALFAEVPSQQSCRLRPVLAQAIADQQLGGSRYDGHWYDVGTPERLAQLNAALSAGTIVRI